MAWKLKTYANMFKIIIAPLAQRPPHNFCMTLIIFQ